MKQITIPFKKYTLLTALTLIAIGLLQGCQIEPISVGTVSSGITLNQSIAAHPSIDDNPILFSESVGGLHSASTLAFGPDGVLFVGDSVGSQVVAFETDDITVTDLSEQTVFVEAVDEAVAAMLGTRATQIEITDLAVNPLSQNVYLAVHRGRSTDAIPVIVRIDRFTSELSIVELESLNANHVEIPSAPDASTQLQAGQYERMMTITDIHYYNGEILVSGVSNEEFASTLRRIPYPFTGEMSMTSLEVWHTVHNQYETQAPIVSMTVREYEDGPYLIAAYTCTPLVKFPLAAVADGEHLVGETIAEMGFGNAPIDLITYPDPTVGKEMLLVTHDQRTPTRIDPDEIAGAPLYNEQFAMNPTGLTQISMPGAGSLQIDVLNDYYVVVMRRNVQTGRLNIATLTSGFFADFLESVVEMNWPDEIYPEEFSGLPFPIALNDFNLSD
ncbi:MAG: hypothetical protein AAF702_48450 [Chloroflexota bacterium]